MLQIKRNGEQNITEQRTSWECGNTYQEIVETIARNTGLTFNQTARAIEIVFDKVDGAEFLQIMGYKEPAIIAKNLAEAIIKYRIKPKKG